MVVTITELSDALGDLLVKATDADIKNVIRAYDQNKTANENVKVLVSTFQRSPLLETCGFLKTLGTDYPAQTSSLNLKSRNKEEYARDIVTFIEYLKPTLCLTCNENYVPTLDDYNNEKCRCYNCSRPCHSNCYKDNGIDPEKGVFFVCSECLSVKTAVNLEACLKSQNGEKNGEKKDEEEEKVEEQLDVTQPRTYPAPPTDPQDCPLYLKRLCPHGLTGKRHIAGKPCPLKHRRLCEYFAAGGPENCKFGRNCRFFHPTDLCQNSMNMKICQSRSCTDFHIRGTRKNPQRSQQEPRQSQRQPEYKSISPWDDRYSTEFPPAERQQTKQQPIRQNTSKSDEESNHFLFKCLQDIKTDLMTHNSSVLKETLQKTLPEIVQHQLSNIPYINMQQIPMNNIPYHPTITESQNYRGAPNQPATNVQQSQQTYQSLPNNQYYQHLAQVQTKDNE